MPMDTRKNLTSCNKSACQQAINKLCSHCLSQVVQGAALPYIRKNAQVATNLQTIKLLQICSQAVNMCSHCLFPVVVTSLEQAINNL